MDSDQRRYSVEPVDATTICYSLLAVSSTASEAIARHHWQPASFIQPHRNYTRWPDKLTVDVGHAWFCGHGRRTDVCDNIIHAGPIFTQHFSVGTRAIIVTFIMVIVCYA